VFETLLITLGFFGLVISVVIKLMCRPIKPRPDRAAGR
jgi:hypothetical protein